MRYLIDKSSSKFTVRAFATGMLSALGHSPTFAIRNFQGELEFSPESPEASSLGVEVNADSLEVMDDIRSKDRQEIETTMNQKVLETAKYPTIAFATTSASASQLGENRYQAGLNGKRIASHWLAGRCRIASCVEAACWHLAADPTPLTRSTSRSSSFIPSS